VYVVRERREKQAAEKPEAAEAEQEEHFSGAAASS
jgi:hypothetical protein